MAGTRPAMTGWGGHDGVGRGAGERIVRPLGINLLLRDHSTSVPSSVLKSFNAACTFGDAVDAGVMRLETDLMADRWRQPQARDRLYLAGERSENPSRHLSGDHRSSITAAVRLSPIRRR